MTAHPFIFNDREALMETVARRLQEEAISAIERTGSFQLALAGGNTPRDLYRCLARRESADALPWEHIGIWFGDERAVPPDHPDSNYRMAREALLDHVEIPPENVHPMCADPAYIRQCAHRYAGEMQAHLPCNEQGMPVLDLVLLGLGDDGHTASLFPRTCILHEMELPVAAVYVPQKKTWRISLTYPTLNQARELMVLATGSAKREIVQHLFTRPPPNPPYPIQRITPAGELSWFLDAEAAAGLPQRREA